MDPAPFVRLCEAMVRGYDVVAREIETELGELAPEVVYRPELRQVRDVLVHGQQAVEEFVDEIDHIDFMWLARWLLTDIAIRLTVRSSFTDEELDRFGCWLDGLRKIAKIRYNGTHHGEPWPLRVAADAPAILIELAVRRLSGRPEKLILPEDDPKRDDLSRLFSNMDRPVHRARQFIGLLYNMAPDRPCPTADAVSNLGPTESVGDDGDGQIRTDQTSSGTA